MLKIYVALHPYMVVVSSSAHNPIRRTTMNVCSRPLPVTTGPVEVCYTCQRHFHPNDMFYCTRCGEALCMDLPTCSGKCRCDEKRE